MDKENAEILYKMVMGTDAAKRSAALIIKGMTKDDLLYTLDYICKQESAAESPDLVFSEDIPRNRVTFYRSADILVAKEAIVYANKKVMSRWAFQHYPEDEISPTIHFVLVSGHGVTPRIEKPLRGWVGKSGMAAVKAYFEIVYSKIPL